MTWRPFFQRPIGVVVLTALLGAAAGGPSVANAASAVAVSSSQAIEDNIAATQSFVGTVEAARVSTVGSAVDGRVGEFLVKEGDRVEKGQVLARLLSEQVQIELGAAKAELDLRQAALQELENGSRPEELAQAKARYLSTQSQWEYTKALLERNERLSQQGAVTPNELHEARTSAQQAYQAHLEAQAGWELARLGPRVEKIAQAKASVAVQQQQVLALEDQLAKHTIRSPFAGFVVEEFVEVGQWVQKSGNVATVVELAEVEIEAPVPENYLPFIRVGTPAMVQVSTLGNEQFEGQVAAIVRRADPLSRTFPIKVRLQNRIEENEVLFNPGMQARIRLPVGSTTKATLVPKDAVVLGGRQAIVHVIVSKGKESTVRPVAVELGLSSGGLIAVEGDIRPGNQVVVQGNERLKAGQAVRVVESIPTESYRPVAAVAQQ